MITVNDYEKTYCCVSDSLNATRHLDEVVEFLQSIARPVTCKEIGTFVWGNAYKDATAKKIYSAHLGQMLRHLYKGGFVKVDYIDGTPVETLSYEYVEPQNAPPRKLRVYDDEGNEYIIDNPKWDCKKHRGHFEDVKKTIIPKIKVYYWVGE